MKVLGTGSLVLAGVSRQPAAAFAEAVALVAEGVAPGVVVVEIVLVGGPAAEDGCNVEEKLGQMVEHAVGMDAPGKCAVEEAGVAEVEVGKGVAAVEMDAAGVDVAAGVDAVVEMDAAEAEEDAAAVVEGVAAATDVEAGVVVVEVDVAAVEVVEDVVEHCDVAVDVAGYGEHCDAAGAAAECDDID